MGSGMLEAILGAGVTIALTVSGFVWKILDSRIEKATSKAEQVGADLMAHKLAMASEKYITTDELKQLLDEKLSPLSTAINHISDWIESQNGIPSLRGRIPTNAKQS